MFSNKDLKNLIIRALTGVFGRLRSISAFGAESGRIIS